MPPTQDQARRQIDQLVQKYGAMSEAERKAITEAGVVHQFLDPLLKALGWPVDDPARYKYELSTQAGRPDMTLIPDQGGAIFLEAKRFGLIKELEQARRTIAGIVTPGQMAQPGMATDRTEQEQQAINYAFKSGGAWAILTNFEKLRLFNARRDWLVLSFERPSAYLDEFDLLWQLSYDSVRGGGLDLLSNQRHREDVDTDYLNFINTWRERLAQDIIARPADNPWALAADGRVNLARLRAVVQRVLDRLVVVRFAEDHLVIPAGALYSLYELRRRNPYTFTLSEFFRRLYERFDEDHNSALFAPNLADRAVFSDEVLGDLVQKLYEARYRAMSADIMGNTYEQYLGKTLVQVDGQVATADNLETRKKQGSYYTPQVIVRYLVDNALGRYLYGTTNGQPEGEPLPAETPKTAAEIRRLRVLDPACGSGSFLIYAYQVLADFYRREIERLETEREARRQALIGQGLTTPIDLRLELTPYTAEIERLQNYPSLILENHLYGVDLDPQAAEIATVNLIMRAMADQRGLKQRLPLILNQNIKVGNSLIGAGPADPRHADHAADLAELVRLRRKLPAETDGAGHQATLQAIDDLAGPLHAALNRGLAGHFQETDAHRPFNWAVEFPEVFLDEAGRGRGDAAGFEVVIGNPPWEIVKPDLREFYAQFDPEVESKLTRRQVEARIAALNAEDPARRARWAAQKAKIEEAAAYYRRAADYTRQGRGDTATHKLFLERGYSLLERQGRLGFVIPSGIYTDLGTKELRQMLLNEGRIEYLFNFSNERFFFPYVDHRFKFTLLGVQRGPQSDGFWATFRFNPRVAVRPEELPNFLADTANLIYIRRDSLARFNPDSLSIMEFQTKRDYEVSEKIYDEWPLLGDSTSDKSWSLKLAYEFHMTNDRHLYNTNGLGLPLYEGKMIHQYDAFYGSPRFWVEKGAGDEAYRKKRTSGSDYLSPRLAVRTIAANTNERTLICTIVPGNVFCGHSLYTEVGQSLSRSTSLFVQAVMNSLTLDFVLRYKVATNVSLYHLYQLPLPCLTTGDPYFEAIVPRAARLTCTTPEFADLWQVVIAAPWPQPPSPAGRGAGASPERSRRGEGQSPSLAGGGGVRGGGGPPATDPAQRQALRDELDAIIAHLYGLSRDDLAHILGAFPLVFPDDEAGQVKKETLLAVYDRFAPDFARKET